MKIILASASPRRSEILTNLHIPFEKRISHLDESQFDMSQPVELVKTLAYEKAKSVLDDKDTGIIVIGADTIVVYRDKILGKPKNPQEAFEFLKMLSGKQHSVYSAIAMIQAGTDQFYLQACETQVQMRSYTDREINAYVETGEPFDKAGAYAIQGYGAALVSTINGDYYNVVGLPISKLIEGFVHFGISYFDSYHEFSEK